MHQVGHLPRVIALHDIFGFELDELGFVLDINQDLCNTRFLLSTVFLNIDIYIYIYMSTHSYTGHAVHCYSYYIITVIPFMSKSFLNLVICSPAVSNWGCDLLTVLSHLSLIVSRLHKIWCCCICWADILLLFLLRIFIDN